jgi:hypothetical protein
VKQNKTHHNLNKNKITPTNNNNVQQQKISWSKDNLESNMQQNHEITCVVHADLKNPEAEKFLTCSNFFWGNFFSKSLLKACMDSWRHTCSDHECEGLTGVMWTSRLQWCCLQHTHTHTHSSFIAEASIQRRALTGGPEDLNVKLWSCNTN